MIQVGEKSKIQIHWKVSPYDYSNERMNSILSLVSKKYKIKKDKIKVIPDFIMTDESGNNIDISNDLINNIQDPTFQCKLFEEYLKINKIENYDFDFIKKIDSDINGLIDFHVYEKHRRYNIKWVKWSNFLSYGEDNFFDFTNFKGLTLLNGEPANQSGKTTFAIDLLHFILFGKTDKASTQDKIFNKWLKESTEVNVEGCISIGGENYIIKRTLSRPQLGKRTKASKTTQKVYYYRLIEDNLEELSDWDGEKQEETASKTNKVIKESIGDEKDFDLIICATSRNLDELIEKKPTERGSILSRWIGLMPIEEKHKVASEKFKTEIKPYLLSNRYNIEQLLQERDCFLLQTSEFFKDIERENAEDEKTLNRIDEINRTKESLLTSKQTIESGLENIDITTLNANINRIVESGKIKTNRQKEIESEISNIEIGEFSMDEYVSLSNESIKINSSIAEKRTEYKFIQKQIETLQKSEFCPTCGKKLDNVDNTEKISKLKENLNQIQEEGQTLKSSLDEINEKLKFMVESREKFDLKSKLNGELSALQVQILQLRQEYQENKTLLDKIKKNEDIIRHNNEVDLNLRNFDFELKGLNSKHETLKEHIAYLRNVISNNEKECETRQKMVSDLQEEAKLVRNWDIYLKMIGKDGISKMVLRKSLPIINAQITHLLSDICDFDVEIEINDKNDVSFSVIKEGIKSDISSCSGFEKTSAALALRFVLAKNSIIPKMGICVLDELFGRVASENLDNIKTLLDRVKTDYETIIIVSHIEKVKEYCDNIITVFKDENGISHLRVNTDK